MLALPELLHLLDCSFNQNTILVQIEDRILGLDLIQPYLEPSIDLVELCA